MDSHLINGISVTDILYWLYFWIAHCYLKMVSTLERAVKLTTNLHPVLRLRMCGAIIPRSHTWSWPGVYWSTWYVFMAWYWIKGRGNY